MRNPLLAAVTLSLAAIMPCAIHSARADAKNGGQIYVKVEHLITPLKAFLSTEAQEQLAQGGVASGKSMLGARVNLAAGVASGKVTFVDSFTLTVPSGAPVRLAPSSPNRIGV